MKVLKKSLRLLFSIYGLSVFLLLMLVLLPVFVVSFLQEDVKGGNLLYKICSFWADAFFLLTGLRYRVSSDELPETTRQYMFISNHISYLDIPMMMKAIRHQHVRVLGKQEMTKIPIFGYIYRKGTVLVDRTDARQRLKSVRQLVYFLSRNISIFICPEGTFNTTRQPLRRFYDGAFKIAIQMQMPIKPVLFLDTYDRLNYNSIFSLNPGRCRAVFLRETSSEGLTMADLDAFREKIFNQMEEALRFYHASWIQ